MYNTCIIIYMYMYCSLYMYIVSCTLLAGDLVSVLWKGVGELCGDLSPRTPSTPLCRCEEVQGKMEVEEGEEGVGRVGRVGRGEGVEWPRG